MCEVDYIMKQDEEPNGLQSNSNGLQGCGKQDRGAWRDCETSQFDRLVDGLCLWTYDILPHSAFMPSRLF